MCQVHQDRGQDNDEDEDDAGDDDLGVGAAGLVVDDTQHVVPHQPLEVAHDVDVGQHQVVEAFAFLHGGVGVQVDLPLVPVVFHAREHGWVIPLLLLVPAREVKGLTKIN